MRISDWSSDVCSSDLVPDRAEAVRLHGVDARASAEDEGASGQEQGRQAPPAAGEAEALSGGEGQSPGRLPAEDRKSVVSGTSVPVRLDLGGRRIIKKTNAISRKGPG